MDVYPDFDRYGKQFKYAEERGIRYALLLSPAEVEAGVVAVKDLVSGEQADVARGRGGRLGGGAGCGVSLGIFSGRGVQTAARLAPRNKRAGGSGHAP